MHTTVVEFLYIGLDLIKTNIRLLMEAKSEQRVVILTLP